MDRTLEESEHPLDLSRLDLPLKHRILSGVSAVQSQETYFRANFGRAISRWKEDGTRVTEADETISREIFTRLGRDFPEDDFCSEESENAETSRPISAEFAWLLDPVDGTNNYAVGIPECGISLGLLRHGIPVYGIIYDNGRNCILQGGPETGSVEDSTPLSVAKDIVNEKLTFCMHFPIPSEAQEKFSYALETWRIRCPGSAAVGLANVAAGRLDGCIEYRSKPWDCAAGYPICLGAGGEFLFLHDECFPMKSFSTSMPTFPFRVGSRRFIEETSRILGL